jgi:hypothetical protein
MNAGLVIFIVTVVGNALTLLFDWGLLRSGRRTITSRVLERPALGIPLLVWQCLALLGLAYHLLVPDP